MAKALKIFLIVIIAITLIVFISLKLFIDEEEIKQQLQDIARQQSNGTLTIDGPLDLVLLPRLSLSLEGLSYKLSESNENMATLDQLKLGVGLWPLLSGRIEVDEVSLAGLDLHLIRDQQGSGNWEQVSKPGPESTKTPAADTGSNTAPMTLSIARLAVSDTAISFEDQAAGTTYALENVAAKSTDLNLTGKSFPLQLAFTLSLPEPELQTRIDLTSKASIDLKKQRYHLDTLQALVSLQGEPTNGKKIQADVTTTADIDLANETISLQKTRLEVQDISVQTEAEFSNWSEQPRLAANMTIAQFNPAKQLPGLGIELPVLENPDSFTALTAHSELVVQGKQVQLNNIDIRLDNSHINGNLSVPDIDKIKLIARFAVDKINLDNYLPAQPQQKSSAKKSSAPPPRQKTPAAEEALLPVETLKNLNYAFTLNIDDLQANGLDFRHIAIKSTANAGLLKLNTFYASFYGGEINAQANLNLRQDIPRLALQQSVSAVEIKPVLKRLAENKTISGQADFDSQLRTQGNSMESWMHNLSGPANFNFHQLAIKELNLEHMTCQAIALVHGNTMPAATENITAIESINGKLQFSKGVLKIQSLNGDMKTLQLKGKGKINPLTEKLDVELGLRVTGELGDKESACRANSRYRDIYWPIQCKGSFADEPAKLCGIDKDKLAKISADVAADELKDKAKDKAEDYLKKLLN